MSRESQTASTERRFQLLRNRVEADVAPPSIVLVTSATQRDGSAFIAHGLAVALSNTQQRTALVSTSDAASAKSSPGSVSPLHMPADSRLASDTGSVQWEVGPNLTLVKISPERFAGMSRASIIEFAENLRERYSYTIIDGGELPDSSIGSLLTDLADGVLIAFLAGRQRQAEDDSMLHALRRSKAVMLGAVMTEQDAIDRHAIQTPVQSKPKSPTRHPSNPLADQLTLQRVGKVI